MKGLFAMYSSLKCAAAIVPLVLAGCRDAVSPVQPPPPNPAVRFYIGGTGLIMTVGQSLYLPTTALRDSIGPFHPDPDSIVWRSADPDVLQVERSGDFGRIMAESPGFAHVFVTYAGHTDSATIRVGSPTGSAPRFTMVATASLATCALDESGRAYCWGFGFDGELGQDSIREFTVVATPIPVVGSQRFTWIGAGDNFFCGLTSTGEAYCWGSEMYGQLGDGRDNHDFFKYGFILGRGHPEPVQGGIHFTKLALGWEHACGLDQQGHAYCWGWNAFGQLGVGSWSEDVKAVTPVTGNRVFVGLAAGGEFTCAWTGDGAVYCWGQDLKDELGTPTNETCFSGDPCSTKPVRVNTNVLFMALSAGNHHTCGVATNSQVYCWGDNGAGENGQSPGGGEFYAPTPLPVGTPSFTQVIATGQGTCALTKAGAAYCWGSNSDAELGDGEPIDLASHPVPQPVSGELTFATLSGGQARGACGVTPDEAVYCWGPDRGGRLGNGTLSTPNERRASAVPVPVLDLGAP